MSGLSIFQPVEPRQIQTRRRSHLPFDTRWPWPDCGKLPTYSVSTWDHDEQDWDLYRAGCTLMALRSVIRALEDAGWSEVSYLIERE
jgi:hypothetical protein